MITVKLYSYLRKEHGRTTTVSYRDGMTIGDLVEELGISRKKALTVFCNHEYPPGTPLMEVGVQDDSTYHILPPAAGG